MRRRQQFSIKKKNFKKCSYKYTYFKAQSSTTHFIVHTSRQQCTQKKKSIRYDVF